MCVPAPRRTPDTSRRWNPREPDYPAFFLQNLTALAHTDRDFPSAGQVLLPLQVC
jgi:hypothetical protein